MSYLLLHYIFGWPEFFAQSTQSFFNLDCDSKAIKKYPKDLLQNYIRKYSMVDPSRAIRVKKVRSVSGKTRAVEM